jgi:hypothetical protein
MGVWVFNETQSEVQYMKGMQLTCEFVILTLNESERGGYQKRINNLTFKK